MKRETLFLKVVVIILGLPVLALCIFLPHVTEFFAELVPNLAFLQYPFLIGLYITAGVFFFALYQTLKLLNYIDKDKAFSNLSVTALKNIKYSAAIIGGLYILFMPLIYLIGEIDDAPGVILIGLIIMFGCAVITIFAAVLQKLLEKAIEIKSDNDLTI